MRICHQVVTYWGGSHGSSAGADENSNPFNLPKQNCSDITVIINLFVKIEASTYNLGR